jgi:hypothetical protein
MAMAYLFGLIVEFPSYAVARRGTRKRVELEPASL